jgi:hypothetical protein
MTEHSAWNWTQDFPDDAGKLGEYLKKTGQPLQCRLDIRITSTEELKKAAVLISDLNKMLNHYAYQDERDPVLRVLMARDAMQQARIRLKHLKAREVAKRPVPQPNPGTTRSVHYPLQVGKLNRSRKATDV